MPRAEARPQVRGLMAPEQIGKGEAAFAAISTRWDLYLMSCSRGTFPTRRIPRSNGDGRIWNLLPKTPSSVVKDIDPAVESAILRCIRRRIPAKRPSSVRQVAAAFPGGDPLAAALAAGETPSPEMVAASSRRPEACGRSFLADAGSSHCVNHCGDSDECTNTGLSARAAGNLLLTSTHAVEPAIPEQSASQLNQPRGS